MYIKINDVNLYYTKAGIGKPLIMLHGNGQTHDIFKRSISLLKEHFTVYAVEFRDHGNSSKVSELHYSDHAEDIYCFINQLNIRKPVYYGFSDGGIVGLMLAYQYPELLSKLIISGPNINPRGLNIYSRYFMKLMYGITKSKKIKMMLDEPDISINDLRKIKVPTYITGGNFDIITTRHLKFIQRHIKNSVLRIYKYHGHGSYVMNSDIIGNYILKVCK